MKFALLGYGFMGGAHLAALQRIPGVEVKSVSTRTRPSADAPARGNMDLASGPLPETVVWNPDWRAVIADPEIDAVDICLPTDMHREVVLAAFAAGKHVLCEKPLARNVSECDELIAAAEKSGRIFMIGQVLRFMYPYRYAAQFINEIGRDKVTHCVLRRSTGYPQWGGWLTQEERSGGAILDLLSHDLDQALSLFGQPKSVSAASIGPVDTMRAVLQYSSGPDVIVEGGWLDPEVAFSAGFEIEAGDARLVHQDNLLIRSLRGVETSVEIPVHDPYFDEIAYFVDCCRNRTPPALCLPSESAQAVKLSLLLKTSREADGQELEWQQ
ncbi:Gfo/Idh/MocA family protein [Edaphobacter albus]|uniref:Gfo/Idh/MocA family protein n=1 Tax=Edaphobacter sp. 4G125 TaxID=2763071 RepID=UPI001645E383|nr:Gfo/Idh/MocA family oxidoreductase [Edaphobacter sp. 4G125]QNI35915.1 Gfo/Idh/MocA family oxidoreductase [Edaphobacter sp. 4G125]